MQTDLSKGVERVQALADCLLAIGNSSRLKIVQYCVTPKKFTNIILDLRLNPASFRFHSRVLADCDLLEKVDRGVYQTTVLGKVVLQFVEAANKLKTPD